MWRVNLMERKKNCNKTTHNFQNHLKILHGPRIQFHRRVQKRETNATARVPNGDLVHERCRPDAGGQSVLRPLCVFLRSFGSVEGRCAAMILWRGHEGTEGPSALSEEALSVRECESGVAVGVLSKIFFP